LTQTDCWFHLNSYSCYVCFCRCWHWCRRANRT